MIMIHSLAISWSAVTSRSLSVFLQETTGRTGVSGWVWALIIVVLVVLIAWWGLRSSRKEPTQPPVTRSESTPIQTFPAREPAPAAPVPPPDDLIIIEGIGPKIASVLQAAGITTFEQLSKMDPNQIEEILQKNGLRLADPSTWAEQARLAAAGDQAGLKALQDRLKGGRQV